MAPLHSPSMPIPEHIHRFWKALDELHFHAEPTWWGAVVTEARFPAIWDFNYARVDVPAPDLTLSEVAAVLLPALAEVGTDTFHVLFFHAEETTDLLVELSTIGHTLSWDLVMDLRDEPTVRPVDVRVEPLEAGDELWSRVRDSLSLFGNDAAVADQLTSIEQETFSAGHKRWLGVRDDDGEIVALAALVLLEDVGYLDNVATFPAGAGPGAGVVDRVPSDRPGPWVGRRPCEPVRGTRRRRGRPHVRAPRLPGGGTARIHARIGRGHPRSPGNVNGG